ncbi:MAG TPA: hypothetical protein VM680_18510 [Verrucomicrobiae bacterium]|nr:hypothetical protein [Verrucomicrobiae bacterium]
MSANKSNPPIALTDVKRDHNALIEFVLEKAADAPVRQRVPVYRALANIMGDTQEATNLRCLADSFESADHLAREFTFRIENPKP